MRLLGMAALLGFCSLLLASRAYATEAVPLTLADLVAKSDRVEIGRVVGLSARKTSDGAAVVTVVTLRVERSLKGSVHPGETLQLLREGGEVPGLGMHIEGAAHFVLGEEVVVFLEQRGPQTWTVGMAQGKMHIETAGEQKLVTQDLHGLTFLGAAPTAIGRGTENAMPLPELVRAILALSSRPARGGR